MMPRELTTAPTEHGRRYVEEFLQELPVGVDRSFLAEAIDSGALLICPRCHFLRLPVHPFPEKLSFHPTRVRVDDCEVCASVWGAIHDGPLATQDLSDYLKPNPNDLKLNDLEPNEQVSYQRCLRAKTLFDLWIGGSQGADAWLSEAVHRAVQDTLSGAQGDAWTEGIQPEKLQSEKAA